MEEYLKDSPFLVSMLLSFRLAAITTFCLLPIGIGLAIYMSGKKTPFKLLLEVLVWMPLVLPPSVLGYYLLISLSPYSTIGAFLSEHFDISLVFTFEGLVFASLIFSLPFMTNPIRTAINSLPPSLMEAALVLGSSKAGAYWRVILPNIKSSILLGCVTSFAHTIGEFGVVLMIGGDIEGVTRVASIALFTEVEATNFALANKYALALTSTCFLLLLVIFVINNKFTREPRA